jgi:hypothetical protein
MLPGDMLAEGGFYTFGSRKGLRPVRLWVGRIDGMSELVPLPDEPVVHVSLMSMTEGMPKLGHAPFYLSALLAVPYQKVPPYDLSGMNFERQYLEWRHEWDAGVAGVWEEEPAEVYRDAIRHLMGKGKQ